jgi:hypothetical protein
METVLIVLAVWFGVSILFAGLFALAVTLVKRRG